LLTRRLPGGGLWHKQRRLEKRRLKTLHIL
jgi:hypothetical protein